MNAEAVIVIGPGASGKSLNKAAIAKAYECEAAYDAFFHDHQIAKASGRILVLADRHPRDPTDRRRRMPGRVVTIGEAREACGDEWIEPCPQR